MKISKFIPLVPSMCKISSKLDFPDLQGFLVILKNIGITIFVIDCLRTQNLSSILSILSMRRIFFIVWWEDSHVRDAAGGTNVIRKRSFSREKSSSSATRDNGFACRKTPVKLRPGKLRVQVLRRCVRLFRILNSRCGEMNKSTRLWRVPRDKYCWIFFWSVFNGFLSGCIFSDTILRFVSICF